MRILAIDTSTEACSAALLIGEAVRERYEIAPQGHSQLILPMVEALLAEAGLTLAQLDGIAFGRGPGSFTGVRIAAGVVQGLAFPNDIPVMGISSLAALATAARREMGAERVVAAIDARMQEVYVAHYVADGTCRMGLQGEEQVCPPAEASQPAEGRWWGIGSGWDSYSAELEGRLNQWVVNWSKEYFPHARDIAALAASDWPAGAVAADQALPVYLRDQVAHKRAT